MRVKLSGVIGVCALVISGMSCENATISGGATGSTSGGTWQVPDNDPGLYGEVFGEEALDAQRGTLFDAPTSGEPVVATWARIIAPSDLETIQQIEDDRVVFGPAASHQIHDLGLMEVISSTDPENFFLRRVLRVERMADGSTVVHTREAAVTEAIIHGSIGFKDYIPPSQKQTSNGLIVNSQENEASGHIYDRQFNVQLDSNRLQISGEFPFGNVSLIPEFEAQVTQTPVAQAGFDAEVELSGTRDMCEILYRTDEPLTLREGLPLIGTYYEWPPELRKLVWAMHWGGNRRAGDAQLSNTSRGGGGSYINFNGERRSRRNRNSSWTVAPAPYVQMRPEFVNALELFEQRVQQDPELGEHFITGGDYIRQPEGSADSREEILSYYRGFRGQLDAPAQRTLDHYLEILENQPDDLQWLSTSLAVAREHCQGETKNADAAVAVKTSFRVRGSVEIKGARGPDLNAEGRLPNGFGVNRATGAYRKNLISKNMPTFWLFPGGFPIPVVPTFNLAAVVPQPEFVGTYKMDYGPYEVIVEGGFNRSTRAGASNSGESESCESSTAGLCGGVTTNVTAGDITITSREATLSASAGVSLVPEFLFKFYGVAGIGGAAPIYTKAEAKAQSRLELNTDHGGNLTGSLCLSSRTGFKVDILGRLESPFAILNDSSGDRSPLAEVRTSLFDSCSAAPDNPLGRLCLKLSGGFKGRLGGDGVNYFDEPTWHVGDDTCPTSSLVVSLEWEEQQDLDLYITEPGDGLLDRNNNSSVGGTRDISQGCTIAPSDNTRCTREADGEPFKEVSTYGKSLGIVVPGTYTVRAENATGTRPVTGVIKVTYKDLTGAERVKEEFTVSLEASRNDSSQEFSFTIPED